VDIEVHTLWESLDAIRAFASPDVEAAVVEPQAQAALTGYDTAVTHFTTLAYLP
jgi:heme-degrading monooxygenase HmoA